MLQKEDEEAAKQASHKEFMAKRHRGVRGEASLLASSNNGNQMSSSRAVSTVPTIGQLLNEFKVPERPRVFKSDPINDENWKAVHPQRNGSMKRKLQNRDMKITANRVGRQGEEDGVNQAATTSPELPLSMNPSDPKVIVDLTNDEHHTDEPPLPNANPPHEAVDHLSSAPQYLMDAQIQAMDQSNVPDPILQQVRDIYQREKVLLPANVTKWLHLKAFVAQHPTSFITPQQCSRVQAHSFQLASRSASQYQRDSSRRGSTPRQSTNAFPVNANAIINHSENDLPTCNSLPESNRVKMEADEMQSLPRLTPEVAFEISSLNGSLGSALRQSREAAKSCIEPSTVNATGRKTPSSYAIKESYPPRLSQDRILDLMEPSSLLSDILPSDAPEGYPRLVEIWEPSLLGLQTHQHEHMNLQDTVVSVIARYDLRTKSAVRAFLDIEGTHHFFFLLRAREGALHSWSIERESDIVTIGIERNHRPPHDNESSRPSAGQYDLTIQYRVNRSTMPLQTSMPSQTEQKDRSTSPHKAPKPRSNYPGHWTFHGTTILPTSPDLHTFLYHTPPTRGADEHAIFTHPIQSHLLHSPPYCANLSILARYMQHTAFTSTLIQAEIQCVWGRKVRYDAVIGRVRSVYDFALKGAKTQKAKRERGDYNRPKLNITENAGDMTTADPSKRNSAVPGAGESKGYLAGTPSKKRSLTAALSPSSNSSEPMTGDTELDSRSSSNFESTHFHSLKDPQGERDGSELPATKKVKVERSVGADEDSGSEYNNKNDDSD